jgi:predicted nucleic acid-binding Zn ribbon protein
MCGSPECLQRFRREWKRRNYKRKAPPPRNCLICAEPFQPIRANNVVCSDRECRLEHKRRLAAERSAGVLRPGDTEIYCVICGDPVMAHHNTVTCAKRDCILERRRRTSRKTKGLQPCRCIVCSTPFWPADRGPGQHYTCSGKCSRIARLRRNRRTYTANRDERLRKLAERLATDPAFRERRRQVDRDSRQRRNATKLLGDLSKVQNTLEEKLSNA